MKNNPGIYYHSKHMFVFSAMLLLNLTLKAQNYEVTVSNNEISDFTSVQAAIDFAPTNRTVPFRIFIKNGKYKEKITIPQNKPFIQLIGESAGKVIITFDDYTGKLLGDRALNISSAASVIVNANDFMATNLTFENSIPDVLQAPTINLNGDKQILLNCRILGNQNSLIANGITGNRQYFKGCYIEGTSDFICGNAKAVFDSCVIYPKDRTDRVANSYITAANTQAGVSWGFVFQNCIIPNNRGVTKYFLGRPWQNDGTSSPISQTKTTFLNTKMGNSVKPEGWVLWNVSTNTSLVSYNEFNSKKLDGSAYDVSKRVTWSKQITDTLANTYNLDNIFSDWKPCAQVPSVCNALIPIIGASNFNGVKGNEPGTLEFSWNSNSGSSGLKYELWRSVDEKVTYSKLFEITSQSDTAYNFSLVDTMPPPPSQGYYYVLKTIKNSTAWSASDTIQYYSSPNLMIIGINLKDFVQDLGSSSTTKSYIISGSNQAGDVKITPPAHFEISINNGKTWSSTPLSISPIKYELSPKTILVRLNAPALGTYAGVILNEAVSGIIQKVNVSGKTQPAPPSVSTKLNFFSFAANDKDSLALRDMGLATSKFNLNNLSISNGMSNVVGGGVSPFSPIAGIAFAPGTTGDGSWTGFNALNRSTYAQFTVSAAEKHLLRIDSLVLNSAFLASSTNNKMAIAYSKSGFTTDSSDVTGGMNGSGALLVPTANGAFTTPILVSQDNVNAPFNYRLALNGTTGVTLEAGETLTLRVYVSSSSTTKGTYAKLKDVYLKGLATKLQEKKDTITQEPVISLLANPVSDWLYIVHRNLKENINFAIYNLNGVMVLSKKGGQSDYTDIDIQNLANGLYVLQFVYKGNKTSLKFVKQ
jgi:pectin methylesterase-like acyl-CoA thioesterase